MVNLTNGSHDTTEVRGAAGEKVSILAKLHVKWRAKTRAKAAPAKDGGPRKETAIPFVLVTDCLLRVLQVTPFSPEMVNPARQ